MSYKIGTVKANRLKKQDGSTDLINASDQFQGGVTAAAVTAHESALDLEQLNIDATLDMGSQKITTTATPSATADLVTKGYADTAYATSSTLSSLSSTVSSNSSTLSSNSSSISSNASNISSNTSSLSSASGSISTNTSNISTNATNIAALSTGMHWQPNAISFEDTPPTSGRTTGDRYVIAAGASSPWNSNIGKIAQFDGSGWAYTTPLDGYAIVAEDDGGVSNFGEGMYWYDSETTAWIQLASTSALSGKAAAGSNADITSLSGLTTALSVAQGGTGSATAPMVGLITAANASAARSVLDVDDKGTDNSTNVSLTSVSGNYLSISGQVITAGTVPVALGGTGSTTAPMIGLVTAADAAAVRSTLGVPTTSDISGMLTSSSAASSLADVSYSSPSSGQALVWNGSAWANSSISAGALNSLSDVFASSPSMGQVLRYSGSSWQNAAVQMDDLGNVNAPSPSTGDMLIWNGSSNKWENGAPALSDLHKDHSDLTSNAMTLIAANMVHYAEFDMGSNAANVTITLPALSSMGTSSKETKMKFVSMPNSGNGTITIQCAGSDLLDGQGSLVIDEAFAGFSLIFSIDGSTVKGWRIA